MAERALCKLVNHYLDGIPRLWYWSVTDMFTSGIPDRVGCVEGMFFAIELKDKNKKPRKLQAWVISKIKAAGGAAISTDDKDEVVRFIEQLRVYGVRSRGRIL